MASCSLNTREKRLQCFSGIEKCALSIQQWSLFPKTGALFSLSFYPSLSATDTMEEEFHLPKGDASLWSETVASGSWWKGEGLSDTNVLVWDIHAPLLLWHSSSPTYRLPINLRKACQPRQKCLFLQGVILNYAFQLESNVNINTRFSSEITGGGQVRCYEWRWPKPSGSLWGVGNYDEGKAFRRETRFFPNRISPIIELLVVSGSHYECKLVAGTLRWRFGFFLLFPTEGN